MPITDALGYSKVWFPANKLEALRRAREALDDLKYAGERLYQELQNAKYTPQLSYEDPRFRHVSRKQWLITSFYWQIYGELWPDGFWEAFNKPSPLSAEDSEYLVHFLEVNPYFFQTGYLKKDVVNKLLKADTSPFQQERLLEVLRRVVFSGWTESLTGWRKLAKFGTEDQVNAIIRDAMIHGSGEAKKRATTLAFSKRGRIKSELTPRLWREAQKWAEYWCGLRVDKPPVVPDDWRIRIDGNWL